MIMIRLKIAQNKKIMNKYLLRIQEKVQNYEKWANNKETIKPATV